MLWKTEQRSFSLLEGSCCETVLLFMILYYSAQWLVHSFRMWVTQVQFLCPRGCKLTSHTSLESAITTSLWTILRVGDTQSVLLKWFLFTCYPFSLAQGTVKYATPIGAASAGRLHWALPLLSLIWAHRLDLRSVSWKVRALRLIPLMLRNDICKLFQK